MLNRRLNWIGWHLGMNKTQQFTHLRPSNRCRSLTISSYHTHPHFQMPLSICEAPFFSARLHSHGFLEVNKHGHASWPLGYHIDLFAFLACSVFGTLPILCVLAGCCHSIPKGNVYRRQDATIFLDQFNLGSKVFFWLLDVSFPDTCAVFFMWYFVYLYNDVFVQTGIPMLL